MVFGLVLVLGLVFGVATMALGANGGNFILGRSNAASTLTKLTGNVDGAAMQVINTNAGADDTALSLQAQAGEAPMRVNSATRVTNLNADKLDGVDSSALLGRDAVLAVVLDGNGAVQLTSHIGTTATKSATGKFRITFPLSTPDIIGTCALTATTETSGPQAAFATVAGSSTHSVLIETYGADGALADPGFLDVVARCGLIAPAQISGTADTARKAE